MNRMWYIVCAAVGMILIQGCTCDCSTCHGVNPWRHVRVEFDTTMCPDISAEGMCAFFYSDEDDYPWRFDFAGTAGGKISIPPNAFSVLAYNNDTYRTIVTDADSYALCSFTTPPTGVFESVAPLSRVAIPGGPPEGSEDVLKMPQMMWCGVRDMVNTATDTVVIIKLVQATGRIRVNISEVANIDDIGRLSAIITGMPSSYRCSTMSSSSESLAAIPFGINRNSAEANTLSGEVMAFVKTDYTVRSYVLLYVWLTDGKKYYYKFDVTDQMSEAPDPYDIELTLGPITIPEASGGGGGGGLDVGVDGWDYVIIDMQS